MFHLSKSKASLSRHTRARQRLLRSRVASCLHVVQLARMNHWWLVELDAGVFVWLSAAPGYRRRGW